MTTWFAQNSGVNIDSVNQWNDLANGTGNWLTWASLGAADVLVANGKTGIIVNAHVTCALITNEPTGGTANGNFTVSASSGYTIAASLRSHSTSVLTVSSTGVQTVVGTVHAPATGSSFSTIQPTVLYAAGLTLHVVGNLDESGTGGSILSCVGYFAILNITGNCISGAHGGGFGFVSSVMRNCLAVTITGSVNTTGGNPIMLSEVSGTLTLIGSGNCSGNTIYRVQGTGAASSVFVLAGDVTGVFAPINHVSYATSIKIHPSAASSLQIARTDAGVRTLYSGGVNVGQPTAANVRSGTTYGAASEYTGTLVVPSPTLVAIGVATDNTVGSYAPTGGLDAAGVRSAIGLASANLDTQLGDIPTFAEFEARSIVAANYATSSVLSTVEGKIDTIDNFIDTEVLAIKAVTDKIDTGLVLDGPVWQFTANMLELAPSGTGGDATLAKQAEILAAIQGSEVIQVASPNVLGNLVLTQGDSYDGIANPKATWTVTTDYTSGWTVVLTIRDKDDAVIYTTSGTVVNSTTITVTIAAPTGLDMTGCPGQWQGKFDVQLTKAESIKTIALGTCYINEDQTR